MFDLNIGVYSTVFFLLFLGCLASDIGFSLTDAVFLRVVISVRAMYTIAKIKVAIIRGANSTSQSTKKSANPPMKEAACKSLLAVAESDSSFNIVLPRASTKEKRSKKRNLFGIRILTEASSAVKRAITMSAVEIAV